MNSPGSTGGATGSDGRSAASEHRRKRGLKGVEIARDALRDEMLKRRQLAPRDEWTQELPVETVETEENGSGHENSA